MIRIPVKNSCCIKIVLLFSIVTLLRIFVDIYALIEYIKNKGVALKQPKIYFDDVKKHSITVIHLPDHKHIVEEYYKARELWVTSNLGTYLFKNAFHKEIKEQGQPNRTFNVMIWKHWKWLRRRHFNSFNECSVKNCRFSGDTNFTTADAVVVHLQKGFLPNITIRDPRQIWIFLSDESPQNTFSLSKQKIPSLTQLAGIFNWSMTYRSESDIPVPYGRTVALRNPKVETLTYAELLDLVPRWWDKQSDVLVMILISNCKARFRMKIIDELKEYINVDVYGGCGNGTKKKVCPGHTRRKCKIVSRYLFYLVLENSLCHEYLTEKVFNHAYGKGAIPVIFGPPLEDCNKLLPPNSFLHISKFKNLQQLALEIMAISQNVTRLLTYHVWRNSFKVLNEHGYFGKKSSHFCRICQALNYNEASEKTYGENEIRLFLDPNGLCTKIN